MICNTIGMTTDSFETLYVHGGAEVPEVYGSINYAQPIFYSLKTLTGATSYSFMGYPEPLKSYEIGGNMVQNGTPTPTSPIYPQECGDRTENLFDYVAYFSSTFIEYGEYFDFEDVQLTPNTTYTFSTNFIEGITPGRIKETPFIVMNSTETPTTAVGGLGNRTTRTLTTDSSGVVRVYKRTASNSTAEIPTLQDFQNGKWVMCNAGSTALPYEPYGYKLPLNLNGTTQNLYLPEPLRKIGDYADEVNSDGTVTRRIKKLVLTGGENWDGRAGQPPNVFFLEFLSTNFVRNTALCTHYINQDSGAFDTLEDKHCLVALSIDGVRSYIGIRDSSYQFKSSFIRFLADQYAAGTPVTIWYVISEPTTEQITAPTLTPATGNNTMTIGTTLQPRSVSITGHIKPTSS